MTTRDLASIVAELTAANDSRMDAYKTSRNAGRMGRYLNLGLT